MAKRTSLETAKMIRDEWRQRFRAGGVPLPAKLRGELLPVRVIQTGGIVESAIFPIAHRTWGCHLAIRCVTESPTLVRFEDIWIELPGADFYFELLDDPLETGTVPVYRFSGPERREFPREGIVNHLFRQGIRRDRPIDGLLLAISRGPVAHLPAGPVQLLVNMADHFDRRACATLTATVEAQAPPLPVSARSRRPLFETAENIEQNTISNLNPDPEESGPVQKYAK